jgi:hypothetical protein
VCRKCICNQRFHFFKETVFSCYSKFRKKVLDCPFSLPELKDTLGSKRVDISRTALWSVEIYLKV